LVLTGGVTQERENNKNRDITKESGSPEKDSMAPDR